MTVMSGLDVVLERGWPSLAGLRLGLVTNQASVTRGLEYGVLRLLRDRRFRVAALFGPQHGPFGHTQDNMIEWEGGRDQVTGLPLFSLYGTVRKPTAEMLEAVDALVIDLQEVGARYYTFIWTMLLCMQAAQEHGKLCVVLDRPNPIGGETIEGNLPAAGYESFVGLLPLTARHGMTMGELAALFAGEHNVRPRLEIVWMEGWQRRQWFEETELPWVMPSPNIPTLETALVYPGMCLLEGTNLSEGRGTTRPFEIFGAPYIEPFALAARLNECDVAGTIFRPLYFQPTFQKHAGQVCGGAQIHVVEPRRYRPYRTAAAILKTVRELYPDDFAWRQPPYEYEYRKLPIDILSGSNRLRELVDAGAGAAEFDSWFSADESRFTAVRESCLHYPE